VLPPAIEGLVYVDAATAERAELPPGLNPAAASLVRLNIDHHADNTRFGDLVWVDATMSATAQMILRLLPAAAIPLTREVATCLLVGVIMDTGGYRFPNTRAAALRDTAELVEAGADYAATIDSLFFQEPYPRRLLEARILQNATFAHQGRVLYAVVGEDWFRTAGVDPADTEGLIDPLRSVAGVDIACLIQVDGAVVRFSLRSRSAAIPVNLIARALGGGGHAQAAGAKVTGLTLEQAETRLLDLTGKALGLG
jgi:phosphoesterase RecJ-like protein